MDHRQVLPDWEKGIFGSHDLPQEIPYPKAYETGVHHFHGHGNLCNGTEQGKGWRRILCSWLYEIKMGGTTFWEQWNTITPDGQVRDSSMNHYAYGAVGDFLYRRVLGPEPLEGGYRSFRVKPILGGGITWAKGSVKTSFGKASVRREIQDTMFTIRVEVPVSTNCELMMPSGTRIQLGSGTHRYTERLA